MNRSLFTLILMGLLSWQIAAVGAQPGADRLTVTVTGKGPDVVLLPGLACSGAVWDATVAHLKKHHRLHVVQLAGFGGAPSKANAQGPVLQPSVDALHTYIAKKKLKAPAVIGHSLGGLMGLMLAVQHTNDVGRLMIVDSFPFFGVLAGAGSVAEVTPRAAAMRDHLLNETKLAYAQGETNFLLGLVKSPAGRQAATTWAVASDKSVVARAMYEDMTTDLRAKLPEIKVPVTVLYPWAPETGMPQGVADNLYASNFAALTNKTLVCISDSFHFIMLDQPNLFASQVDAFLK